MVLYDDNDKVARIIKQLDKRISDLEGSTKGSGGTPRVAPSARDELFIEDDVSGLDHHTPAPAQWDDATGGGWDIDTWSD